MRTLQEKYNGIQEGKFSKDHFIVEARMQHPTLVTRFNGYDDAVQILKNRGMIQESVGLSDYSDAALADMIVNLSRYEGNEKEIEGVKQELAKRKENLKENYKEFTSQEKAKEDKAKQEKLGASKNLKIGDKVKVSAAAAKKLKLDPEKEYTIRGFREHGKGTLKSVDVLFTGNDSVNIDHVKKSIKEAGGHANFGSMAFSNAKPKKEEPKEGEVHLKSLKSGDNFLFPGNSLEYVVKTVYADGTVSVGYTDGTGHMELMGTSIVIPIKPEVGENIHNSASMGGILSTGRNYDREKQEDKAAFAEIKALIAGGSPEEAAIEIVGNKYKLRTAYLKRMYDANRENMKEARLTKNSLTDYRYKPTNDMDKYPYEQILRGLRVELEGLGITATPTPEEYKKALAKVLKNLEKDEIYYTNQLAGVSKKVDLHDKMVDATAKNTVDTFNGMKKATLKEGIKNLLKTILAEDLTDYERAARAIEFGVPEHPEEDAYQMQGSKSDQDFKSELDSYLEDNQIYGYTNKIHDIMTQEDPNQAAEDLAVFLDRNQIYGYNRGIEAIYNDYPYENMHEGSEEPEEDEIDYDDENFSDPFIDGEDDIFESVSLKDLLN